MLAVVACQPGGTEILPSAPRLVLDRLDPVVAEQIGAAEKRFERAPKSAATNGELAMTLHAYRQLEWADVFYQRARLLDPHDFRWVYLHAVVLEAQGQAADQEAALRAALALNADSVPTRLRLAQLLSNNSDTEESARLFESILADEPDHPQALFGLGSLQLRVGGASGLALLERAAAVRGPYGAASYALAGAYRTRGEVETAEGHLALFENSRNQAPKLTDPLLDQVMSRNQSRQGHMNRALRLLGEGQMQTAAKEFELALKRDPDNAAAHTYLVVVYGELSRYAEAEAHYEAGLALDPGRVKLHYNYGVLQLKQRRLDEAVLAFRRALALDENYINAYLNLGAVFEARKQPDEAAEQYRAALAHDPENRQAGYFLGRALLRTRDYSGAAAQLERVLEPVDQRTPDYLLALAHAYRGLGESDKSEAALRRAIAVAKRTGRHDVLRKLDAAKQGNTP